MLLKESDFIFSSRYGEMLFIRATGAFWRSEWVIWNFCSWMLSRAETSYKAEACPYPRNKSWFTLFIFSLKNINRKWWIFYLRSGLLGRILKYIVMIHISISWWLLFSFHLPILKVNQVLSLKIDTGCITLLWDNNDELEYSRERIVIFFRNTKIEWNVERLMDVYCSNEPQ